MFSAVRRNDGKLFVMKPLEQMGGIFEEKMRECELYDSIQSEYVMRPHEIYLYKKRIFIIFEDMDGGDLSKIILNYLEKQCSENFCKYTLYKALLG